QGGINMAHIEVQVMILPRIISAGVPAKIPTTEAAESLSQDYEKGDIRLRPGPIITILARDKSSELIISDLIPYRQGSVQEILYFSDDNYWQLRTLQIKENLCLRSRKSNSVPRIHYHETGRTETHRHP
ncbi:MAG: hypothetical protein ACXVZU_04450, partial [Methanobacteriaceae archaeon]